MKLMLSIIGFLGVSSLAYAATCCNTPTVWTFKNLDAVAVSLTCKLEKSAAWKGDLISMTTGKMPPAHTHIHKWASEWYADGMGMIPGTWSCRPSDKADDSADTLTFSTDWGENVTITWNKSKGKVAKK